MPGSHAPGRGGPDVPLPLSHRVKSVAAGLQAFQLGEWRVEPELDRICSGGRVIKLEPRVMKVLLHLAAHVGHTASITEILEDVWPDVIVGPDSVYQAMNALRRVLGDDPHRPTYITHPTVMRATPRC
jgi:transcriptional activator of cad operon